MQKLIDLTGHRFGKWTVLHKISSGRNGNTRWKCVCDCGITKDVYGGHLKGGKSKSCGCNRAKGPNHVQWTGCGDISGNFWDQIKRSADGSKGRRKLEMNITIEQAWQLFLDQDKKCAISGLPLYIGWRTNPKHNASLDRIDSSLGYILSNVQWVHKDINMMKRNYNQQYFVKLCCLIAKHSGGKCTLV